MTSAEIKLSKFLENGIEFSCQMCGDCCRGFKEGEVYLYKEDIVRLANHLSLKGEKGLRSFAKQYLKVIKDNFFWRSPEETKGKTYKFHTLGFKFTGDDEHCHFLVNNICTVHEVRPFQCRCFPFWKMMVTNKKNLVRYSKKCPGLRLLKGKFYTRSEILEWARKEYKIEKEYFLEMKKHNFEIAKVYPFLPKEMIENAKKDLNK
ncbi:MAG: YkgJ family cysteine cluster protein [Candidatus Hermodarchaeota archaeon]